jgi:hypothetical protein
MPAIARAARAAALLLGAAAASLAALEAGRRLSDLSVNDVQDLLQKHNLAKFMGKEFEEFLIDGEALIVLSENTLPREEFPKAKRFHWDKFFALLRTLREEEGEDRTAAGASSSSARSPQRAQQRRQLSAMVEGAAKIHIKRDEAALVMGAQGDVALERTGEGELSVSARLLLANSTGGMVDVAARLEELLAAAAAAQSDTRIDTLIEMVALNTELLLNVSASCEAGAAPEPEAVILYTCKDAMAVEAPTGRFETEDYGHVHCQNDIALGGWTLAFNVDTSDGCVAARMKM